MNVMLSSHEKLKHIYAYSRQNVYLLYVSVPRNVACETEDVFIHLRTKGH